LFWQIAGLHNGDGSRYVMESELTVANLKVMKWDVARTHLGLGSLMGWVPGSLQIDFRILNVLGKFELGWALFQLLRLSVY